MMFHKILVAIDQSQLNQQVFEAALSLAQALKGQLMVLHTLTTEEEQAPKFPALTGMEYYSTSDTKVWEAYQQEWRAYTDRSSALLRSLKNEAQERDIQAEVAQPLGRAGPTICDFAKQWGANLIVIGRRGRSGLQELIMGSVSNYVLHHAPCSVLIVAAE